MKTRIYLIALFILVGTSSMFAQEETDKRPPREKWFLEAVEGTVKEINKETRDITLMGQQGELITFTASEEVKRFDEIAVGDVIAFEYWTYIKAEFRRPTAEELATPIEMIAEAGKAPDDMAPGAMIGAVVKAVVSIEVINRPYMIVTVRGPQGNYTTLPVEDPALIEQLNVGEIVILTYAEAVAVALEKKSPVDVPLEEGKKKKNKK
ncbi:MAG: hypothetical protein JXR07_08730 [Reichenbachiella sp.]